MKDHAKPNRLLVYMSTTLLFVALLTMIAMKLIDRQAVITPEVSEGSTVGSTDTWMTFTHEMPAFTLSYPGTVPDPTLETILLPAGTGENKERKMNVEVIKLNDSRLTSAYCYTPGKGVKAKTRQNAFTADGHAFCLTDFSDAGAGSVFRTEAYVTVMGEEAVIISFSIRYPTSVQFYEGCEDEAVPTSEYCTSLAFDETRDTALFTEILKTFATP